MSREDMLNRLAILTGGRAAEEVAFESITSGASNDIEKATSIARAMITRYGMSDQFGMVALETVQNPYLSADASLMCSQDTSARVDAEVQKMIADGMNVPVEKVYGVSTFYAQFSLSPKGEYNFSVCLGTACYVKGAQELIDKLEEVLGISAKECTPDGRFSLEDCRCIGACGLAPVMTVNDEVYGKIEAKDIPGIVAKYQA